MALARVVSFDGVSASRVEEMKQQIGEGPPDDIPAKEIVMLHDAEAEKSVVIVFFDNEDDYARGDATLSAMPADETPGTRTAVGKYEVAVRLTV
ncbi:MAG: hypothetical protein JWO14_1667 [Solirubrobacterales bacterium]|jgi:hypothetical protein|nr:hypothetical protein [Solirubrobacterales bacterium]